MIQNMFLEVLPALVTPIAFLICLSMIMIKQIRTSVFLFVLRIIDLIFSGHLILRVLNVLQVSPFRKSVLPKKTQDTVFVEEISVPPKPVTDWEWKF